MDKQTFDPAASYLAPTVAGFRADPASRFGGKDRMETRPTQFDTDTVLQLADAVRFAQTLGMPTVSPEMLVNKMLVEGRADAGTNEYNRKNPRAKALHDTMLKMGYERVPAAFVAAVLDKTEAAKRTGRPFDEVWNGTGRSSDTKRTGKQHAERAAEMKYAATNPKNAEFLNLVSRVINSGRTPQESMLADLNAKDEYHKVFDEKLRYGTVPFTNSEIRARVVENLMDNMASASGDKIIELKNALTAVNSLPGNAWRQTVQNMVRDAVQLPRNEYRNATYPATSRTLMDVVSSIPAVKQELDKFVGLELIPDR